MSWQDWFGGWQCNQPAVTVCCRKAEVEQIEVGDDETGSKEATNEVLSATEGSNAELINSDVVEGDDTREVLEGVEHPELPTDAPVKGSSFRSLPPLGAKGSLIDAWRGQVMRVIQPGIAALVLGMGSLADDFHRQRKVFADPVVAFLFADGRTVEHPGSQRENSDQPRSKANSSSQGSDMDMMSPSGQSAASDKTAQSKASKASSGSWFSWASGPSHHDEAGPRSIRLRQRVGKELEIMPGTEEACAPDEVITNAVIKPGEVEVLATRRICTPDCLSQWNDSMHTCTSMRSASSITIGDQDVAKRIHNATDFGLSLQLPCTSWLFRAAVEGFQQGPLYNLAKRGISGKEALDALGKVWPHTMAFMGNIFTLPKCVLNITQAKYACVRVTLNCPFDFENLTKMYPKVAQLLRITKSLRIRFTEHATPLKTGKQKKADKAVKKQKEDEDNEDQQKKPYNEAFALNYNDGEMNMTFLMCGQLLAWQTRQGEPRIRNGKVAVVQPPISPATEPAPADLYLYGHVDNAKLKLSEFGCLGMGSLSLPDANIVFAISTSPASMPAKLDLHGSYGTLSHSMSSSFSPQPMRREAEVVSHVAMRILDMSAFPVEAVVRPFFDIKLMRFLLINSMQASWNIRPMVNGEWQMVSHVQASVPRVARAFRMCFKHFASSQIRESDWLRLFAHMFTALGKDFAQHEVDLAAESQSDLVNRPDSTLEPQPTTG